MNQNKHLSVAGQGDGANPARSPAGYETPRPATPPKLGVPIETGNNFGVLPAVESVRIQCLGIRLPKEAALNLAAWIVAIADPERKDFDRMLNEILK